MDALILTLAVAIGFGVAFAAEGVIVGKLFQPGILFIAYVTIAAPPWPSVAAVALVAAVGATIGQWALYRVFTPTQPLPGSDRWLLGTLYRFPKIVRRKMGVRVVRITERQVDRFGSAGVVVCTTLPVVRTVVPIVAGVGAQPERRYVIACGVGNLGHLLVVVAAAYGVLGIGRLYFAF